MLNVEMQFEVADQFSSLLEFQASPRELGNPDRPFPSDFRQLSPYGRCRDLSKVLISRNPEWDYAVKWLLSDAGIPPTIKVQPPELDSLSGFPSTLSASSVSSVFTANVSSGNLSSFNLPDFKLDHDPSFRATVDRAMQWSLGEDELFPGVKPNKIEQRMTFILDRSPPPARRVGRPPKHAGIKASPNGRCTSCDALQTSQWRFVHGRRHCNACYAKLRRWMSRHNLLMSSATDTRRGWQAVAPVPNRQSL